MVDEIGDSSKRRFLDYVVIAMAEQPTTSADLEASAQRLNELYEREHRAQRQMSLTDQLLAKAGYDFAVERDMERQERRAAPPQMIRKVTENPPLLVHKVTTRPPPEDGDNITTLDDDIIGQLIDMIGEETGAALAELENRLGDRITALEDEIASLRDELETRTKKPDNVTSLRSGNVAS